MAEVEHVTGNEILAQEGASRPVTPHTFLQLIGVRLAIGVGGLVAVVIMLLLGYWICTAPRVSGALPTDLDKLKQVVEVQKQLSDLHLDPVLKLFDDIVLKCLLPLFTSILGYIFGSQTAKQNGD